MRKLKLRRATKVPEAILLGSGRGLILTWVLQTSKPALFPIFYTSIWKQEMSHLSSDGFPGEECLSSHWSTLICWVPFVTNCNTKVAPIFKLIDWGGAASYGWRSHLTRHSSNALSSLREFYNRYLDGKKKVNYHFNTMGLTWANNFLKLL